MDNLKIKITDDAERYHTKKDTTPAVLGELNFGNDLVPMAENDTLENLCEAILALFPSDPVKLEISYSVSNH
jgi:hypothetical protein|tara:strand:+ start:343 stop:558 length:216 start_codon:yes stop_codon:yes gene_type:complete